MTSVLDEDILYLVIALWKLEKPMVREAPSGAFRYFVEDTRGKMKKKEFLTYDEQIAFLKGKNLKIKNEEYAKHILFKTGYFSLVNGYKEMYKDPLTNQFREDASFEDIYELYRLDHELRSIFIKYILIVERNVKSSLSYHFCDIYGDSQEDYLDVCHYVPYKIGKLQIQGFSEPTTPNKIKQSYHITQKAARSRPRAAFLRGKLGRRQDFSKK